MALTKVRGGGVDSLFDDEDSNIIIGRGRIGNTISASDHASFQHRDLSTGSNLNYAILQTASGGTQINSSSGQSLFINIGNSQAIKVDSNKIITMENQPAFLVQPSTAQIDFPINASTTIAYGTEIFDQNADFSSNTFTAPVTGRYQLNINLYLQSLDHDVNYYQPELHTSNRTYYFIIGTTGFDADVNYYNLNFCSLVDMDANDTAHVVFRTRNLGAAQVDLGTESWFSGYLVC